MISVEAFEPGVFHIEIRRPEKRNALNDEMYRALAKALEKIRDQPHARVLLLSSQGNVFCAGTDVSELATHWPQPEDGPVLRFLRALHNFDLPIVAAVQGAAVGLGATLLLHCDLVVASPSAFLQFPFVDLGITVEGAGSLLIQERVGYSRAMEILLTCRQVPSDEARELGLVTHISADRDPLIASKELATALARKSPDAIRTTKGLLQRRATSVSERFGEEIAAINKLLTAL